jgi:hypothetical protein
MERKQACTGDAYRASPVGEKQLWSSPELRRLDAGSAENADQAGFDDGINSAS